MKTLKETIDKELGIGGSGRVDINSASLSAGAAVKTEEVVSVPKEVKGDVTTTLDKDEAIDPMLAKGAERIAGPEISKDKVKTAGESEIKKLMGVPDGLDTVTITEEDRSAFLDSIVTGQRYVRKDLLYNGRITVEFRCRSASESHAILALLNIECQDGTINTNLDYSTRLRNMVLAAQVKRVNGVEFTELKTPLMSVYNTAEKKVDKPAWVDQMLYWQNYENEGVASAIYKQLQLFERKYWVMIGSAVDQNFWQTAGSI